MITRRRFIGNTALAALSILVLESEIFALNKGKKLKNIGFITGIVGKELKGDWKAVLKQAVEFGFTEMETGQFLGDSAKNFNAFCKEIGIKVFAGGIGFTDKSEELKIQLDKVNELGANYAVTYWPWLTGGPFTLEDCKKSAEILNKMGEISKSSGLKLCWHNHDKEFVAMEEGLPFDYLMKNTDKDLVFCELDIYWATKGNADPIQLLKKDKNRVKILHVKDMAPGDERTFACPGSGIIDFPAVFSEALNQGIKHYIVEQDNVTDGLACLKSSGTYLKGLDMK